MTEQQIKLAEWQRVLLSQAASISHRIASTEPLPDDFYQNLTVSLERLAERVKRGMSQ